MDVSSYFTVPSSSASPSTPLQSSRKKSSTKPSTKKTSPKTPVQKKKHEIPSSAPLPKRNITLIELSEKELKKKARHYKVLPAEKKADRKLREEKAAENKRLEQYYDDLQKEKITIEEFNRNLPPIPLEHLT